MNESQNTKNLDSVPPPLPPKDEPKPEVMPRCHRCGSAFPHGPTCPVCRAPRCTSCSE